MESLSRSCCLTLRTRRNFCIMLYFVRKNFSITLYFSRNNSRCIIYFLSCKARNYDKKRGKRAANGRGKFRMTYKSSWLLGAAYMAPPNSFLNLYTLSFSSLTFSSICSLLSLISVSSLVSFSKLVWTRYDGGILIKY